MYGALRKAERSGHGRAALDSGLGSGLDIAQVVERVEYTDDVNAVLHRFFNKHFNYLVGIVLIPKQILTSQQHLKL